jgi:hypothetical protein
MKSALLILDVPSRPEERQALRLKTAVSRIHDALLSEPSIERLNEYSFLIDLDNGMRPLAILLHFCIEESQPYRVLFFEESPAFVYSDRR